MSDTRTETVWSRWARLRGASISRSGAGFGVVVVVVVVVAVVGVETVAGALAAVDWEVEWFAPHAPTASARTTEALTDINRRGDSAFTIESSVSA